MSKRTQSRYHSRVKPRWASFACEILEARDLLSVTSTPFEGAQAVKIDSGNDVETASSERKMEINAVRANSETNKDDSDRAEGDNSTTSIASPRRRNTSHCKTLPRWERPMCRRSPPPPFPNR